MRIRTAVLASFALASIGMAGTDRKQASQSALDRYIEEAIKGGQTVSTASPGSLWSPGGALTDLAADPRASQVNDSITVLVVERASAVAKGTTSASRSSAADATIPALGGALDAAGRLANLASLAGATQLDGQSTTSRDVVLTATVTGRVTHVLPNGYMVIEATKETQVNSERQVITLRGVVRPSDLTSGSLVRSDRLAQLEVRVNGKGVVSDAVRRPMFLYRLLLGLLPF